MLLKFSFYLLSQNLFFSCISLGMAKPRNICYRFQNVHSSWSLNHSSGRGDKQNVHALSLQFYHCLQRMSFLFLQFTRRWSRWLHCHLRFKFFTWVRKIHLSKCSHCSIEQQIQTQVQCRDSQLVPTGYWLVYIQWYRLSSESMGYKQTKGIHWLTLNYMYSPILFEHPNLILILKFKCYKLDFSSNISSNKTSLHISFKRHASMNF